jgi:pyruvate,water dikinase
VHGVFRCGKSVFQDVLLPEIRRRQQELDGFVGRDLSSREAASFLAESLSYVEHMGEMHWKVVWAAAYVEGWGGMPTFWGQFENELGDLTASERRDLIYRPTILSEERRTCIRMAELVRSDSELSGQFAVQPYDRILYARLARTAGGRLLLDAIDTYLETFGHYPAGPWRPVGAILAERPEAVVGRIRPYLGIDLKEFDSTIAAIIREKEKLTKRIVEGMTETARARFEGALALAEKSFLTRDDHAHYTDNRMTSYLRLAAREAGRILASGGILDRPTDVWLLRSSEIVGALLGSSSWDDDLLRKRRADNERRRSLLAPDYLGPPPETQPHEESPRREAALAGMSGLPRVVRGRVRKPGAERLTLDEPAVVVIPDERALDIIPYLGRVVGLVVASGSPLSHIGIIARELGIPAIFAVTGAMEELNDGDEIELDGVNDRVLVLGRASNGPPGR